MSKKIKPFKAATLPQEKESVLKKYEPKPLTVEVKIAWDGEGLVVELSEGHHITIPETMNGLRVLRNLLIARKAAFLVGAQPKIGSDVHLTQAQVNAFLKMKIPDYEESMSEGRIGKEDEAVEKGMKEGGF